MRIAYDHQIFGWQKYGGISRYFFELADNIAQNTSHEVSIISPLHVNAYIHSASPRLQVRGCTVPQLRRTGRLYRAANQYLAAPMLARFSPDIVHETYYASTRRAPRRAKVVLTVFDMIHERFPESFRARDTTASEKAAAVARADHVICISENTRRDLIDILNVDPAKTSVAYLGFSLTQPAITTPVIVGRPYLLYVGSRGGYKNFYALLQAYAMRTDLQEAYDLLAFGGGAWLDAELERARALGIDERRLRHMQGDDSLLASLYRGASLFVYPSLYEGFGIPPLEAMSFGCPVVSGNASSLPEVVGDAAELFDPGSPSALLAAIERVLGDSAYRKALVERGHERTQLFSWKRCAEQTLGVYEKVLA
jgi:glycosyltransferase involved in cell wall biosynthesis